MKYRFLRFPDFKTKAVTFSFDDGTIHDRKLVEIMNRSGIKGTFNISGVSFLEEDSGHLTHEELRTLFFPYGHEVANHGMTHSAPINLTNAEGFSEVLNGRKTIEQFYGKILRGFALPDRSEMNETIRSYLPMTGIAYARTGSSSGTFALPENFFAWQPTCKHTSPEAIPLAETFLAADPRTVYKARRDSLLYYVWGHSFECPADNWENITRLCQTLGGHEDVWYATNIDICDYINAYRALLVSVDNSLLYNPSPLTIWLDWDEQQFVIHPGETLRIF